jgi:molybdopterin converting factor small subunit
MRVTVLFSKVLTDKIGLSSIDVDISTYRDVLEACQNLLPSIKKVIRKRTVLSLVCNDKIIQPYELDFKISSTKVTLVPTVAGGISSSFDSLGNLNIFYGANKAYSTEQQTLSGINRRIVDSSLFGQSQTAFDIIQRKNSRADGTLEGNGDPTTGFGALNITSIYGQSIPLHFGLVRTSGSVINSYVKHVQRGEADTVRVSDYV